MDRANSSKPIMLAVILFAVTFIPATASKASANNGELRRQQIFQLFSTNGSRPRSISELMALRRESLATMNQWRNLSMNPQCASCRHDCPVSCRRGPLYYPSMTPTPTPTAIVSPSNQNLTKPPCSGHPADPPCGNSTCISCPHKFPSKYPNLPSITYSTNCYFSDHDLYTLTWVAQPFDCAARCAVDSTCSHFTHIANLNGGTCHLKKAFGSGAAWASSLSSPSHYVCGYIANRALIDMVLKVCVGVDITGSARAGY